METSKETATGGSTPRRVIKRYSNRKLYDTRDSRYVTLQQIGEMVRAGEEVQIIDNKTKEDKTEVTLALILSEDLRSEPRSVPLAALRDLIQERGGKLLSQLREGPIGRFIPGADDEEDAGNEPGAVQAAPAAPEPAHEAAAIADDGKKADEAKKRRLSELVESSFGSLIPSLKSLSELQAEVQRLSARVEELEKRLESHAKSHGSGDQP
jgi:polyhydroxyalkanoate synthesis repressor PhaR